MGKKSHFKVTFRSSPAPGDVAQWRFTSLCLEQLLEFLRTGRSKISFFPRDSLVATPPTCYRSLLGPSARSVPGVFSGCLWGPSGPGLRSVQRLSQECRRSVKKVSRTLRGHSRDTFWTLQRPGPEGPQRHPEGHFRDTSGPKGPRDSCSRSGGLQFFGSLNPFRIPNCFSGNYSECKNDCMYATYIFSQTEMYPAWNWSLEMPQEPSSRPEPYYWIKFLDPWVQDCYPVLGWGLATL